MIATRMRYSLLLAACLAGGCSDATAPEASLVLTVSPDTVRLSATSNTVRVAYTSRNANPFAITTAWSPDVQSELTPGMWTSVDTAKTSRYISDALGIEFAANYTNQRAEDLVLNPGRYRLRATYRRADSTRVAVGDVREAVSNIFVVIR